MAFDTSRMEGVMYAEAGLSKATIATVMTAG